MSDLAGEATKLREIRANHLHDDGGRFAREHLVDALSQEALHGPLVLGATLTPEGLVLERAGPAVDKIYPFVQDGEPDVVYHSLSGTGWQDIFQ